MAAFEVEIAAVVDGKDWVYKHTIEKKDHDESRIEVVLPQHLEHLTLTVQRDQNGG